MKVVLLERVKNLGQMGDVVAVRPGYARNHLFPGKKALRATKENIAFFESRRAHLELDNLNRKKDAEAVLQKVNDLEVRLVRQASETGHLYGSVRTHDIAEVLGSLGFHIHKNKIHIPGAIKTLGVYPLTISLHPEVSATIRLHVVHSEESFISSEEEPDEDLG